MRANAGVVERHFEEPGSQDLDKRTGDRFSYGLQTESRIRCAELCW